MTIAENVFGIGREPGSRLFVSWVAASPDTRAITDRIGLQSAADDARARPRSPSSSWSKSPALSMRSKLIVMDEPTSALSETEVANLARIIRTLKAEGLSIIFVSHRLEEVFRLCDRYTVLRDERAISSAPARSP